METLCLKMSSSEAVAKELGKSGLREPERLPETEGLSARLGCTFCVPFIHGLGFPC